MSSDELYDIEEDPYEMKNLIMSDEHKSVRNHLHDLLLDWMNQTRDPFRGYYWEEYEPRQLDYGTGLPMGDAHRLKGK